MCQGVSGKVLSRHKQANDVLYLDADHRFSDRREKSALNKACLKRWKEERVERLDISMGMGGQSHSDTISVPSHSSPRYQGSGASQAGPGGEWELV